MECFPWSIPYLLRPTEFKLTLVTLLSQNDNDLFTYFLANANCFFLLLLLTNERLFSFDETLKSDFWNFSFKGLVEALKLPLACTSRALAFVFFLLHAHFSWCRCSTSSSSQNIFNTICLFYKRTIVFLKTVHYAILP